MAKNSKDAQPAQQDAPRGAALVQMERTAEDARGGSLTADVHPDEVANYAAAGWRVSQ